MRQCFVAAAFVVAVGVLQAEPAQDKQGSVKGLHLCCKQCETSVTTILDKVEGISEVKTDRKSKSVTFAAKDKAAFQKAFDALYDGGFAGTGDFENTAYARTSDSSPGRADEVTVKGVHACCGQCNGIIKGLFKDLTVTITGKGAQKDVRISGKDLSVNEVMQKLAGAGFSGKLDAKK